MSASAGLPCKTHQKVLLGRGQRRELEFVVVVHSAGCSGAGGPALRAVSMFPRGGVSWTIGAVCCEAPHACPPCCPLTDVSRDRAADGKQDSWRERERERERGSEREGDLWWWIREAQGAFYLFIYLDFIYLFIFDICVLFIYLLFTCLFVYLFIYLFIFHTFIHSFIQDFHIHPVNTSSKSQFTLSATKHQQTNKTKFRSLPN